MGSKKSISLVCLLMVICMLLSACATNTNEKSNGGGKGNTAGDDYIPSVESKVNDAEMIGNMYVSGLPIAKEKDSFTIFMDGEYSMDPENMALVKKMEAETNVHVEWMMYPYEAAMEKIRLLLNSDNYPDAIAGWTIGGSDIVNYGQKEGIFIPLEDMIAKYAPNVEAVLNIGNTRRSMTLPNGHIYSPPYLEVEPQLCFGPWINQNWLTKLGLDMPKTTDELYDVLVAFRDRDPNGNGEKDEIPLSARADDFDQFAYWFSLFGPPASLSSINGELVYGPSEDSYKVGIQYFAKLYREGLLDQEVFTQDGIQYDSKCKSEEAILGMGIAYDVSALSPGRDPEDNTKYIRLEDYKPLPPLENGIGTTPRWNRQNEGGLTLFKSMFVITNKAKQPEMIVRWLDNLFQLDNSIQSMWGVYDYTLQKKDDGTYERISNDRTLQPDYTDFPSGQMLRYIPKDINKMIKREPWQEYAASQNDALDALWSPANMMDVELSLWLSQEESDSIASIEVDIGNYVKQKRAEWVSGESDVEAEWDAYIEHLNKLGLPKLMDVYRNALKVSLGK